MKYVKDALPVIAFYLTCLINTSIVTGVFPSDWKHAVVVPILKNGDEDNVGNFKPMSLLSILSKVLEKIVSKQLTQFLERNKLISNSQHGFRPRLSTETALTTVTDAIYDAMDNRKIYLLSLCDLSKVFDSIKHSFLLANCLKLKIDSFWFSSYLMDRTQTVR